MTKGYVYIMTNEAMPGLVKIGKTTRNPATRAIELHQTGVPFPFKVVVAVFAPDCHELERTVHDELRDYRVSPDREFFRCDFVLADLSLLNSHREQVELWLDEFLPDHIAIQPEFTVDESATSELADAYGIHPIEMVGAFGLLTVEEVSGAVARLEEKYKENRERMDAERFPVSGDVIQ